MAVIYKNRLFWITIEQKVFFLHAMSLKVKKMKARFCPIKLLLIYDLSSQDISENMFDYMLAQSVTTIVNSLPIFWKPKLIDFDLSLGSFSDNNNYYMLLYNLTTEPV